MSGVKVAFSDLTQRETLKVLHHLPANGAATVVRTPTVIGARRFTVATDEMSVRDTLDLINGVHGYMDAVSKGQAR